ncbi:MAG: hypothetical protein U0531_19365 [Dehalococcoidia bacterium]
MTIQQVSFRPPAPEEAMLLQALSGNQEDTDAFLGVINGITPLAQFMAPDNLGRIIAAAQQRATPA